MKRDGQELLKEELERVKRRHAEAKKAKKRASEGSPQTRREKVARAAGAALAEVDDGEVRGVLEARRRKRKRLVGK